jgi:signal transduction histidine kinase
MNGTSQLTAVERRADDVPSTRILAAADAARRRLERDLHDGAQQRFVVASLALKRALNEARGTSAESHVAEALNHVRQGLIELRDLARGIHPAALSQWGLAPALADLAARSPAAVELDVPDERLAPSVETAIYFTVAESLTNVAKHARATLVKVRVEIDADEIVASVADDGVGGARTADGSGLSGLADRLGAVGGALTIDSPAGVGTIVRATIPVV